MLGGDSDVDIRIKATDEASKKVKEIDQAFGQLDQGLEKTGKGFAESAITAAKWVAGLAIAREGIQLLGAGLRFAIAEASEAQAVQAQLNAVLESTGGVAGVSAAEVNALSDSLDNVTRFSDEAITSAQSLMLTFTKIGSEVFPQSIEAATNMSTALGTDLQSSVIMLGKALNDPITGITAMTRAGIQFTEEQKGMIKSLVETGDLVGAQTVILKELETQFGGAAKAAGGTFAGQLDILKNALGNVAEEAGNQLLPVLTDLTSEVGPEVVELFGSLSDQIIPMVVDAVNDLGGGLVDLLTDFNALRRGVQSAEDAAVESNMSYEEYLRTVADGGTLTRIAASRWSDLIRVWGGGGAMLDLLRRSVGLLSDEQLEQAQLMADAETATDGWLASVSDGSAHMSQSFIPAVEKSSSALTTLDATLASASEEQAIMAGILAGDLNPEMQKFYDNVNIIGEVGTVYAKALGTMTAGTHQLGLTTESITEQMQEYIDLLADQATPEALSYQLAMLSVVAAFQAGELSASEAKTALENLQDAMTLGEPVITTYAGLTAAWGTDWANVATGIGGTLTALENLLLFLTNNPQLFNALGQRTVVEIINGTDESSNPNPGGSSGDDYGPGNSGASGGVDPTQKGPSFAGSGVVNLVVDGQVLASVTANHLGAMLQQARASGAGYTGQ